MNRYDYELCSFCPVGSVVFPVELMQYGLTLEVLECAIENMSWSVQEIPNVEFYRKLHYFLKKWDKTRFLTKTCIGKFYLGVDIHLQERGSTPVNTYKFIDKLASSDVPDTALMSYGANKKFSYLQAKIEGFQDQCRSLSDKVEEQEAEIRELKSSQEDYKGLSDKVEEQQAEIQELKNNLESGTDDLLFAKETLRKLSKEKSDLAKKQNCLQKKLHKAKDVNEATLTDLLTIEDELQEENSKLVDKLKENGSVAEPDGAEGENHVVSVRTKEGKVFNTGVRQLHYSLLADGMAPAKIPGTIKSVLHCFVPDLDVDSIKLPHSRCAGYMRKEELKTISMAHKASTIVQSETLHLNSDGTTKFQKKIGGVAINGMVFSLNEVPDGTADSTIEDIARELDKLRDIARALKLSNPDKINWTLFASSTSDSAASQKRFNRLLQQRRDDDQEKYGFPDAETTELVENMCAMHLGSNLRKAFWDGVKDQLKSAEASTCEGRDYSSVDTFIYEFCKLFGTCGVPEYACGRSFKDFLQLKVTECSPEDSCYYRSCAQVSLERQVGNRYFVSAANATRILFLVKAAMEYLQYTGKYEGNNLECTVFKKLLDTELLARLKADAIMHYFVYSELAMLAKSEELKKSAFDMNTHYLELKLFLEMIEEEPSTAMDRNYKVFVSEDRLYGSEKKINHRIRPRNSALHSRLFESDEWDASVLHPVLQVGVSKMKGKLMDYARNQLPGGVYWAPEPAVKEVLKGLRANNDLCESILGLNDYLMTAVPNLHQQTRSNLVEVKKNGTIAWYESLPSEKQEAITKLAVTRRKQVMQETKEAEKELSQKRQESMKQSHERRLALKAKAQKEKEMLSQEHLIETVTELCEAMNEIDSESIPPSKTKQRKLKVLRTQVNIRKKVLKQNINITFTKARKQRPLTDIINDLKKFITEYPAHDPLPATPMPTDHDPFSLVGKEIQHRFIVESGEEQWFCGFVLGYNTNNKMHELIYNGETDHQHFDLSEDIRNGDVKLL